MASIREKRPGYWEVRVFVGYDDAGKPVQVSKSVKGFCRDAERLAAKLAGCGVSAVWAGCPMIRGRMSLVKGGLNEAIHD